MLIKMRKVSYKISLTLRNERFLRRIVEPLKHKDTETKSYSSAGNTLNNERLHKSFIFCSLLLTITSALHSKEFIQLGNTHDSHVTLGTGYDEHHLPIAECYFNPSTSMTICELHLHTVYNETCRITIADGHNSIAWVKELHQLVDNKVIVVYRLSDGTSNRTAITAHDMNVCFSPSVFKFPEHSRPNVVAYTRSFDVIVDGEITAYSRDGIKGMSESFAFKKPRLHVYPVSVKGHTKDLFVMSKHKDATTMHLVDHHGNLKRHLLHFDRSHDFVSHNGHSLHSFCWNKVGYRGAIYTDIECRQLNDSGHEMYKDKFETKGVNVLIDVRSSKDGGVVIFMVSDNAKKLMIVNKPTDRQVSYPLSTHVTMKVVDFDEENGTFKLAYETFDREHGHIVKLREYELP